MKCSLVSLARAATLSLAITALAASVATAQTPASTPPAGATTQTAQSPSTPKVDIFAGAGLWQEDGSAWTGLHLSGAVRPWRRVAFVGDLAFFEPRTTLTGGVRVYGTMQKVSVFGQLLVGTAPLDDFALQPGLGLDVRLTRRVAIRVAGDVKVSGDGGSTWVGFRLSTGVVLLLGGK